MDIKDIVLAAISMVENSTKEVGSNSFSRVNSVKRTSLNSLGNSFSDVKSAMQVNSTLIKDVQNLSASIDSMYSPKDVASNFLQSFERHGMNKPRRQDVISSCYTSQSALAKNTSMYENQNLATDSLALFKKRLQNILITIKSLPNKQDKLDLAIDFLSCELQRLS